MERTLPSGMEMCQHWGSRHGVYNSVSHLGKLQPEKQFPFSIMLLCHLYTVLACCCVPGPELCLLNFMQIAPILRSREKVLPWATEASSQRLHGHTQSHFCMGGVTFMEPSWQEADFPKSPGLSLSPSLSVTQECPPVTIQVYTCSENKKTKSPYLELMEEVLLAHWVNFCLLPTLRNLRAVVSFPCVLKAEGSTGHSTQLAFIILFLF